MDDQLEELQLQLDDLERFRPMLEEKYQHFLRAEERNTRSIEEHEAQARWRANQRARERQHAVAAGYGHLGHLFPDKPRRLPGQAGSGKPPLAGTAGGPPGGT